MPGQAPSTSLAISRGPYRDARDPVAIRRLTFHRPLQVNSRSAAGPSKARFQVDIPRPATRGLVGQVVKAVVIEVAKIGLDKGVSLALPKLAEAFEKAAWKKRGLKEGWLRVTKDTLATGALEAGKPASPDGPSCSSTEHFPMRPPSFARWPTRLSSIAWKPRTTIGSSRSIISASAERPKRTPGCCSRAAGTDDDVRRRHAFARRPRPPELWSSARTQFGDLARRFKPGRVVLVASPERRHAAGDAETLGRHGRLDCQPARDAFRTTHSRPERHSSPTASYGSPIMRRAIFPGCTRWTATER